MQVLPVVVALLELGCAPVDTGNAELRPVERDCCAPEEFYSTTNHETNVRAVELLWQLIVRSGRDGDPMVRDAWAQVFTRIQTARFQQIRMEAVPDDELIGTERAIDKLFLVQSLRAIGELAAQLLGPAFVADTGEWGTYGWNRWLMGALGYRIAGGTDEVLRVMLAERLLGLPRDPR